jgi:aminoglycoside phosphotransferase (APT) family kinase protein
MPLDADTVRSILVALGRPSATATHLGEGFASDAWLVHDGDVRLVLRIERPDAGYPNSYRIEHERMAALVAAGAVVPTPVTGSWEVVPDAALAYSLTTHLPGSPTSNGALAGLVDQVAAFLRVLHGMPATGDMRPALMERFADGIWPIGGRPLSAHPALAGRPALRARVERHAIAVQAAMERPPLVLVHSDMHEENMLSDGDRLAFIDFGEAFEGAAAWEFASIAYFTSWDLSDAILVRYLDDPAAALAWRADVALLALSFGLCRWEQDIDMALDTDAYNEGFLRQTLGRIETATIGPMEIMGVQIRTIVHDNVARRCDGCLEIIDGTPWRVNLLDIVASESPVAWTERPTINPGPFQFHGEPACVRRWMAGKGYLFCRRGEVREILRPIAIPGETVRWGLCDGIHRDDHEFVPA